MDVDSAVDSTQSNSRSCQGIIPSCKGRSPALLLLFKYGRLNSAADYSILQVANSNRCNLFSKTCSGFGIVWERITHTGVRCDDCHKVWHDKSSQLKKLLDRDETSLASAERCLYIPYLCERDMVAMVNFTWTPGDHLNKTAGILLKTMVEHRIEFYKLNKVSNSFLVNKLDCKLAALTKLLHSYLLNKEITHQFKTHKSGISGSLVVVVQNSDSFLRSFVSTYRANPDMKDTTIMACVSTMMLKIKGRENHQVAPSAFNLFVAMNAISQSVFDFCSANLFGPALSSIQRSNAKTRGSHIMTVDAKDLHGRMMHHLQKIFKFKDEIKCSLPVMLSIGFDGTKVPEALQMDWAIKSSLVPCGPII